MYEGRIHIGKAAALTGVTPQTLRNWDGNGKLRAARSAGDHRYYTLDQLQPYLAAVDAIGWLWATQPTAPNVTSEYYCERQDRFSSRLEKLGAILAGGQLPESLASLITLIVGEIGDNSFAHNVGQWRDVPGLLFAYDLDHRQIVLADRGQGILATLSRVRPSLVDDRSALRVAFTEIVSGRDPENRGNGLKVVKRVVEMNPLKLRFQSGAALVMLPQSGTRFSIRVTSQAVTGIYAVLSW